MKTFICAVAVGALVACAKKETYNAPSTTTAAPALNTSTTASQPAEETYPMTATIVSRDAAKNTVNLDNKEVPGKMMAMKMDYELRGAKVDALPANGSAVEVTMHEKDGKYFVTDVKPMPKK